MSPRVRKETSRFQATDHPGINRDRRSGIYYFRGAVSNDELQSVFVDKSLKTKSISIALERAKRIKVKIAQGDRPTQKRRKCREAFDLVLKVQSPKAKGTSSQAIAIIEGHLIPWFEKNCEYMDLFVTKYEEVWADYRLTASGRKLPKYLEDEDGDSDRRRLKKSRARDKWHADPKNRTPRKLEHDRRYLNMALKRAFRAGWIKKEFKQKDFELNEVSDDIGQYIEDADLKRLLKGSAALSDKLFLQILLSSHLGLRISETLHLRKEEVDLKAAVINLDPKRVKTRRRREVPIPIMDEVFPYLEAAYKAAKGEFIFPAQRWSREDQEHVVAVDLTQPQDNNRWFWDKVRAVTGLDVRFHDLRHTAITNALLAGLPDFTARKIFGVNEKTMRRIYAHVSPDIQSKFRKLYCGKYVDLR